MEKHMNHKQKGGVTYLLGTKRQIKRTINNKMNHEKNPIGTKSMENNLKDWSSSSLCLQDLLSVRSFARALEEPPLTLLAISGNQNPIAKTMIVFFLPQFQTKPPLAAS